MRLAGGISHFPPAKAFSPETHREASCSGQPRMRLSRTAWIECGGGIRTHNASTFGFWRPYKRRVYLYSATPHSEERSTGVPRCLPQNNMWLRWCGPFVRRWSACRASILPETRPTRCSDRGEPSSTSSFAGLSRLSDSRLILRGSVTPQRSNPPLPISTGPVERCLSLRAD